MIHINEDVDNKIFQQAPPSGGNVYIKHAVYVLLEYFVCIYNHLINVLIEYILFRSM